MVPPYKTNNDSPLLKPDKVGYTRDAPIAIPINGDPPNFFIAV